MIKFAVNYEPIVNQVVPFSEPALPGESIRLLLEQRVTTTILGVYVSSHLSGRAVGVESGREIPGSEWSTQLKVAYGDLEASAQPNPSGWRISPMGYGFLALGCASLAAVAWGMIEPQLNERAGTTIDAARARVSATFEAPRSGQLLLISEPGGRSFRWHKIVQISPQNVALRGTSSTQELDLSPLPSDLKFDGSTVEVPRDQFRENGGTIQLEGAMRLVANATESSPSAKGQP